VRIISRNGTDYTAAIREIVEGAMKLPARAAVLDGEAVVLDERGRSSVQLLQQSRRAGAAWPTSRLTFSRSTARISRCR
jgi:bifunctional non-homologous end joining protein LigD